jgi:serine/threonine protein kinase
MDNTNEKEVLSNLSEIAFLSIFSHPNIVKYIASYKVKKEVWMIMEFMEGGTLSEAVKAYNFYESQIAYVAREILKGLEYLHSMNYGHRDLKSSNVMMTVQGQIKLIDFGLCTDFSNGPKQHTVGSPFWIPPEMIQNKPHNLKVDIWSFAVCILEMVLKAPPYRESKMKAMYLVGTEGLLPLVNKTKMSDNLKDFFHKCLQMEPSQRNSAKELLQHKFIQNADNQKSMESIIASIFLRKSMTKGGVI